MAAAAAPAACQPGRVLSSSSAQPRRLLAAQQLRSAQLLPCCRRLQPRGPPPAAAAAGQWPGGADRQQQQQQQQPDRQVVEADTIIDPDGTVRLQPQSTEDRRDLWRRAIKLPMYSVGWAPILVGAGLGAWAGTRCVVLLRDQTVLQSAWRGAQHSQSGRSRGGGWYMPKRQGWMARAVWVLTQSCTPGCRSARHRRTCRRGRLILCAPSCSAWPPPP